MLGSKRLRSVARTVDGAATCAKTVGAFAFPAVVQESDNGPKVLMIFSPDLNFKLRHYRILIAKRWLVAVRYTSPFASTRFF